MSNEQWSVGKDAFLACTQGIVTEYKAQGLSKAIFSGEGLYVYKISGQGILYVTSFGAIIRKDVSFGPVSLRLWLTPHRFKKTRNISSTTDILLLGTASTSSSGQQVAVLYPTGRLAKA